MPVRRHLAQDPAQLKAYLDSNPDMPLDGCAGKIVSGFTWRYVGVCSAEQGQKLLGANGKPLRSQCADPLPRPDAMLPSSATVSRGDH